MIILDNMANLKAIDTINSDLYKSIGYILYKVLYFSNRYNRTADETEPVR